MSFLQIVLYMVATVGISVAAFLALVYFLSLLV